MTVGEKIKRIRKEKGLTQKELGTRLGNISQQQIGQWETGKANPKIETLQRIADALNVALFEFLDDDLFDAATAPTTMENAMYEVELVAAKLKSIEDNINLSNAEKEKLIQDFIIQTEIVADMHLTHAEAASKYLLNQLFSQLNCDGQNKAIEHVEMLTKIPEYQKGNKPPED